MNKGNRRREAGIDRQTGETKISLELLLDGEGNSEVSTGVGFLDHMLSLLAWHSGIDLSIKAEGDLDVDPHHTVEDVGIVLGQALREALGEKRGIARYGYFVLPMDDTLVAAAIDLSGRFWYVSDYKPVLDNLGNMPADMVNHFFYSMACEARMNLHFKFLNQGDNEHHRVEAMFKAYGKALAQAVSLTRKVEEVPSTKGSL